LIKCLFHVHFEEYKTLSASFILESMNVFMSKDGVILNIPTRHKSRLERRDYLGEDILQSIGKDFRDDFIINVA
jgi:hypothetical protein